MGWPTTPQWQSASRSSDYFNKDVAVSGFLVTAAPLAAVLLYTVLLVLRMQGYNEHVEQEQGLAHNSSLAICQEILRDGETS
jgi:hypothetical protein